MDVFSSHRASPSLLPEVQVQQVTSQPCPEAPVGGGPAATRIESSVETDAPN